MTYYKFDQHILQAQPRFESKYQIMPSGCWHWIMALDADGYGTFGMNINKQRYRLRAHRYSWILHNKQDWPANMPVARHLCNNPCCVNPAHIKPGTVSENTLDSIAAGTYVNGTKKPIRTPIGDFESGREAAKALGIRHPHLIRLLREHPDEYQRLTILKTN